jgi:hypothetical protein
MNILATISASETAIFIVVMLLCVAVLILAAIRQIYWEERMLKYELRSFFHLVAFVVLIGCGLFLYIQIAHPHLFSHIHLGLPKSSTKTTAKPTIVKNHK